MIEIVGKYNRAVCYCREMDEKAREQIRAVCDQQAFEGLQIRIMPDVHAGRGCTIGTTMTIRDKVVPGMVGVDIGCGMETVLLEQRQVDLQRLDQWIHRAIPSGMNVRAVPHAYSQYAQLEALRCRDHVNLDYARRSVGTLGGGNHFIEVDRDEEGRMYLVIHSGSRHLGVEVAEYYQDQGRRALWGGANQQIRETIAALKSQGRQREIEAAVRELRREHPVDLPRDLCYVEGQLLEDYLHDMKLVQDFAAWNRQAMVRDILEGLGLTAAEAFTTVHNYIDTDSRVLRKGAVSARKGERLLIPINMRDGSLICTGRGNKEWNCSAPHGAGRLMSRMAARRELTMETFRAEMAGVYTTCVVPGTLDESPMAYKGMEEIVEQIGPTADIVTRLRPVYNFKAAE